MKLISKVFNPHIQIPFPLYREEMGVKKYYLKNEEDQSINTMIVDKVLVYLNKMGVYNVGSFTASFLNTATFAIVRIATKNGIVNDAICLAELPTLYSTPQLAAKGNKSKKIVSNSNVYNWSFGSVLQECFDNSCLNGLYAIYSDKDYVAYGYYKWDGFKPIFTPFDLEHNYLIAFGKEGWHFGNDNFRPLLKNEILYKTMEDCIKDNSLKVYDFPN